MEKTTFVWERRSASRRPHYLLLVATTASLSFLHIFAVFFFFYTVRNKHAVLSRRARAYCVCLIQTSSTRYLSWLVFLFLKVTVSIPVNKNAGNKEVVSECLLKLIVVCSLPVIWLMCCLKGQVALHVLRALCFLHSVVESASYASRLKIQQHFVFF